MILKVISILFFLSEMCMDGRGEYLKTSCSQVATNGVRRSRTAET